MRRLSSLRGGAGALAGRTSLVVWAAGRELPAVARYASSSAGEARRPRSSERATAAVISRGYQAAPSLCGINAHQGTGRLL